MNERKRKNYSTKLLSQEKLTWSFEKFNYVCARLKQKSIFILLSIVQ